MSIILSSEAAPVAGETPEQMFFAEDPSAFIDWFDGPEGDANVLADDGQTPLWVKAIETRHSLGLALLAQKKIDWAAGLSQLRSKNLEALLLLMQLEVGHPQSLQEVLASDINPNCTLQVMQTVPNFLLHVVEKKPVTLPVLHIYAESMDADMLEALLAQGADIGARDSEGNTVGHVAGTRLAVAPDGQLPVLNVLKKYNLDVTIKNNTGHTPLEYMRAFFQAVSPELMNHPSYLQASDLLSPDGKASSIILLG